MARPVQTSVSTLAFMVDRLKKSANYLFLVIVYNNKGNWTIMKDVSPEGEGGGLLTTKRKSEKMGRGTLF